MAFKKKSKGNDKYVRLTGLWPSKNTDGLWTGRFRAEDMEKLLEKANEAAENGAPLVFSLWENGEKESRKDPDFTLQCFVGDADEQPRSRSKYGSKKKSTRDEEEEEEESEEEEEEQEEEESEEEEDEAPKKKATKKPASKRREKW